MDHDDVSDLPHPYIDDNPDDWCLLSVSESLADAQAQWVPFERLPADAVGAHAFYQAYFAFTGDHSTTIPTAGSWRLIPYAAQFCRRIGASELATLWDEDFSALNALGADRVDAIADNTGAALIEASDFGQQVNDLLWNRQIEALIRADHDDEERPLLRRANAFAAQTPTIARVHDDHIRPILIDPAHQRRQRELEFQQRLESWRSQTLNREEPLHYAARLMDRAGIEGVIPDSIDRTLDQAPGLSIVEWKGQTFLLASYRDAVELIDLASGNAIDTEAIPKDTSWQNSRSNLWTKAKAPQWRYDEQEQAVEVLAPQPSWRNLFGLFSSK